MNKDVNIGYQLGQRDMLASILAETKDKIKLTEQAQFYKEHYEEHFSNKWHTTNE